MEFAVDIEAGMAWYGDERYEWTERSTGSGYWAPVMDEQERELSEALARAMLT